MNNDAPMWNHGAIHRQIEQAREALQFPRVPPGMMHPMTNRFAVPPGAGQSPVMPVSLDDFQDSYRRYVQGLLEGKQIIPPGHPMHDRQAVVGALKQEKDMLLKENIELKRQLDEARAQQPGVKPY